MNYSFLKYLNMQAIIDRFEDAKNNAGFKLIFVGLMDTLRYAKEKDYVDFKVKHDPILYTMNIYLLYYDGILADQNQMWKWGDHLYGRTDLRSKEFVLYKAVRRAKSGCVKVDTIVKYYDLLTIFAICNEGRLVMQNDKIYLAEDKAYLDKLDRITRPIYHDVIPKEAEPMVFIEKSKKAHLSPDQCKAIELINKYRIAFVTGNAGTGKTTVIRSIYEYFADMDRLDKLYLLTPTNMAAENIRERLGGDVNGFVDTIHQLKNRLKKEYVRSGLGQHPRDSMIVFDEASMLDNVLVEFMDIDAKNQCRNRFLFVGDIDQLPPVARDSLFGVLLHVFPYSTVRLTTNFRSDDIIISNANMVLNSSKCCLLARSNYKIGVIKHVSEIINDMPPIGKNTMFITYRNDDVLAINHALQQVFLLAKYGQQQLEDGSKLHAFTQQMTIYKNGMPSAQWKWYVGDKARSLTTIRGKICNGTIGTVVGFNGTRIRIEKRNGMVVEVDHKKVWPAYCVTVHGAQGQEWDNVVFVDFSGGEPLDRALLYVALTRARKTMQIVRKGVEPEDAMKFEMLDDTKEVLRIMEEF